MKKRLATRKSVEGDTLAEYRGRILYWLSITVLILITPLAIINILDGHIALGIGILGIVAILLVNAVAAIRRITIPGVVPVFLVGIFIVIWMSISTRSVMGVFWLYPTVLFISFVVRHRVAKFYLAFFFIYSSALICTYVETQIAVRAITGLLATIVFTTTFLNFIYSLREKLLLESMCDPLTGALNRRELGFALDGSIERKQRSGETATLVSFDIDEFKSINDKFGHAAGDRVLVSVVDIISHRTRVLDQLFRVGGDEFILLLPMTTAAEAETLANSVREKIAAAGLISEQKITISVGICELEVNISEGEWLENTDRALYEAKAAGRNRAERWKKPTANGNIRQAKIQQLSNQTL